MLNALSKKLEQKASIKAEDHLKKALELLNGKLFKQAMIEFNQALKLDTKNVGLKLEREFKNYHDAGEMEAAFSIGAILFKVKNKDYQFANQLGNCARKQGNYKHANNFYRHALKINRRFEIAFYNLAASMAKVERYDEGIKTALKDIYKTDYYVFPEYAGNQDITKIIAEALTQKKEKDKADQLQNMLLEKEELEVTHEFVKAKKLGHEMKLLEQKLDTPKPEETIDYFLQDIEEQQLQKNPEADQNILDSQYNLVLYSLKHRKGKTAIEVLKALSKKKHSFDYVEMLMAIAYDLINEKEKATNIFIKLLGEKRNNRYYNVNLGLFYKRKGNRLLAVKYLLIGAVLLEKSDGLYRISDLIRIANQHFETGALKKALNLYKVVIAEENNLDVYFSMGEIYIVQEKYDEAKDSYFEILKNEPKSEKAKIQLKKIHDYFCQKGEEFFQNGVFKVAARNYESALKTQRRSITIKRTAEIYKFMKNHEKADELMEEYQEIKKKEEEAEKEATRLGYIQKGKTFMKMKNMRKAIENFELAFRMKVDKDVFVFLASIYRKLNRTFDMQNLLERWNKMVEYEEKMKKFQKEEERAKSVH